MRIAMLTNLYEPLVGGIQRSIASFAEAFRERGHDVLIVTPEVTHIPHTDGPDIVRVPAIQKFNGSDFSVPLVVPPAVIARIDEFAPQIIHSHHPFLLGDSALRIAASRGVPLLFTYHTMWEYYTHYTPSNSEAMRTFVIRMAAEYAQLADQVIAPSESVAAILRERGVTTPVAVVPTGIDPRRFAGRNRTSARRRFKIPPAAFVLGHVGRLSVEKNLDFLARCAVPFFQAEPRGRFLLVGEGPWQETLVQQFVDAGLRDRLIATGKLTGDELVDSYYAMDVFVFASRSETQGLVLAEAMMAGTPVVALDAPGAREIVRDRQNGRLLGVGHRPMAADGNSAAVSELNRSADAGAGPVPGAALSLAGADANLAETEFVEALHWMAARTPTQRRSMTLAARRTAAEYTIDRCAERALAVYAEVVQRSPKPRPEDNPWQQALRRLAAEWNLWTGRAGAVVSAVTGTTGTLPERPPTPEPEQILVSEQVPHVPL